MNISNVKSFQDQWAFPSEVKAKLGAASYEIRPLPENFRSGRPKLECLFFDRDRKLISRRLAMELVSKRTGTKYHVCAREESATKLQSADLLLDEIYRTP